MIVVASESVRAAEKATREDDTRRRRRREEARVKQPEGFIRTGLAMG